MNKYCVKISTLTIYSEVPFERKEDEFINALSYLLSALKSMDKINVFSMYIGARTFLIAEHDYQKDCDPFCFVNEKGDVLFEVDIKVFEPSINEFQDYIKYRIKRNPDLPYEKQLQYAIKDYKNDKLDFYANSKVVSQELLQKARDRYLLGKVAKKDSQAAEYEETEVFDESFTVVNSNINKRQHCKDAR